MYYIHGDVKLQECFIKPYIKVISNSVMKSKVTGLK